MNTTLKLAICLPLLFIASCKSRPLTMEEIAGVYTLNKSWVQAELILNDDFTYSYRATRNDGQVYSSEGAWELYESTLHGYHANIQIPNFVDADICNYQESMHHELGSIHEINPYIARRFFGRIEISYCPDHVRFTKVEQIHQ